MISCIPGVADEGINHEEWMHPTDDEDGRQTEEDERWTDGQTKIAIQIIWQVSL